MFKSIKGAMGVAHKIDNDDAYKNEKISRHLVDGEEIQAAFKLVRDLIVITNLRFIQIDIQGITGKKTTYYSVPYSAIVMVTVESAGHFDLDGELNISISGGLEIKVEVSGDCNIHEIAGLIIKAKA